VSVPTRSRRSRPGRAPPRRTWTIAPRPRAPSAAKANPSPPYPASLSSWATGRWSRPVGSVGSRDGDGLTHYPAVDPRVWPQTVVSPAAARDRRRDL